VVYQGHHGDAGAGRADVILPGAAYTEKSGTYVNTEGRVQRTKAAVGKLANARDDWRILRALSEVMQRPLPYDTVDQIRQRLIDIAPTFEHIDKLPAPTTAPTKLTRADAPSAIDSAAVRLRGLIDNYWFTDAISRSSLTMAKCNQLMRGAKNSYKQTAAAQ